MVRKSSLIVLFCFCAMLVFSQKITWDGIKANRAVYICGEGYGETIDEADKRALSDLANQISVSVSSRTNTKDEEWITDTSLNFSQQFSSTINTYSRATFNDAEKFVISDEPDAHVGRYIKRTDLQRIFDERKNKILDFVKLAEKAEEQANVDVALKNYYWAYMLLQTMQYPDAVKYKSENGEEYTLSSYIPNRMDAIFDDIVIGVTSVNQGDVDLSVSFRGKPVGAMDYIYSDGGGAWSSLCQAKNGRGVVGLVPGIEVSALHFKIEYAYKQEADKEMESVFESVKSKSFRKSNIQIPLGKKQETPIVKIERDLATPATMIVAKSDSKPIESAMNEIVSAIKQKQFESVVKLFTPEGYEMFQKLIHYGNARVLEYSGCTYTKMGDRIVARSVPMSFSFKNGVLKYFVEDVTFTFNSDGKVESLAFGLGDVATRDVMSKSSWTDESKQTIVSFLENYKTAFALKDIGYIESIFDDNALIIVGHVIKLAPSEVSNRYANNVYVKKTKYSKSQYIKHLRQCFASNEFVNIRFENNEVLKAGSNKEIYGIQIKQDYYSSNYSDVGYLYLQVDLQDAEKPIITVRTWQEEPDPDLGRVYGMGDF